MRVGRIKIMPVLLFLSASSIATAQQTLGAVHVTGVSGERGSVIVTETTVSTEAMIAIRWRERYDKPCELSISVGTFGSPAWEGRQLRAINICNGDGPSRLNAGEGSFREIRRSDPKEFVSKLKTCMTSTLSTRFKGLILHTDRLDILPGGELVFNTGTQFSAAQPNCMMMQSEVYCPTGQIAVGVSVHHANEAIIGFALRCKALTMQHHEVVRRP